MMMILMMTTIVALLLHRSNRSSVRNENIDNGDDDQWLL